MLIGWHSSVDSSAVFRPSITGFESRLRTIAVLYFVRRQKKKLMEFAILLK